MLPASLYVSMLVLATEYWVAPDGDDAATGTMADPWATIEHADTIVAPGDIVHVLAGEYSATFDTVANGTEDARIVFVSEPKWGARLIGEGGGWRIRGEWVDVVGFEVTGNAAVGLFSLASHVRFLDNWVHHLNPACDSNGGAGIDAGNYDAEDVDLIGNIVHDIWAEDDEGAPCRLVHGLYHAIKFGTIANNIAWHNSGWGIHTWHNPSDLVITNNLVFGNRGGIIVGAGDSPGDGFADNFLVANNIVIFNTIGIREFGATGLGNRYIANLMFENETDFMLKNGLVDEGTIVGDPLFVDWQLDGSGDYRLAENSPGIDAGTPEGAPAIDIDGVARPQGGGFDVGPYELPVDMGTSSSGGGDGTSSEGSSGGAGSTTDTDAGGVDGPAAGDTTGHAVDDTATRSGGGSADDGAAGGCGCTWRHPPGGSALFLLAWLIRGRRCRTVRRSSDAG